MSSHSPYTGPVGGGLQGTLPNPTVVGENASLVLAVQAFANRIPGFSLVNWAEGINTTLPNNGVFAITWTVLSASAAADACIIPKGSGAFQLGPPADNTGVGGSKRGLNAVDLQTARNAATQVALANYSALGGGFRNDISATNATYSNITGGALNVINNITGAVGSTITGGESNTISSSGNDNTITGGSSNTISTNAVQSTILGGQSNLIAGGTEFRVASGQLALARDCRGARAHACGQIASTGDSQAGEYVLRVQTTDATVTAITATRFGASATNQPPLPSSSAFAFSALIVARSSGNNTAAWTVVGLIKNSSGTVSLVSVPVVTQIGVDAGAATWALAVVADNTNKCLQFNATGQAATTINWCATVRTAETTT